MLECISVIGTSPDIPVAGRGTKDRYIGFIVAVVVSGHRNIFCQTELANIIRAIARFPDIPDTGRRTINCDIVAAVAVKIAFHGNISRLTESDDADAARGAVNPIPD